MCADVPAAYRGLPAELAGIELTGPRVGFLTDAQDPTAASRFFCAQYYGAPHPLQRLHVGWFDPAGKGPSWPALLVHVDDPARLEAFLERLAAESQRQGRTSEARPLAPGMVLVRWGEQP
jgi:hypothetical protein